MTQSDKVSFSFSKKAWQYYTGLYVGQYHRVLTSTLISALQALLIVPVILLVRYAFDVIIPDKNIYLLIVAGFLIFLLRSLNSMLSIWIRKIHLSIINKAIFNLRKDLIDRLYSFSVSFFTGQDIKVLHTRIVVDTERVGNMSNVIVSRVFPSLIICLALAVLLFIISWKLMLIVLVLVPMLYMANYLTGKIVKKRVFTFQRVFENFSKSVFFILKYFDLVLIQSARQKETMKEKEVLTELQHHTNRMSIIYTINAQIQDILTSLIGITIIVLGGIDVINTKMSLGDFLSFYIAAGYLNRFVNSISTAIPEIIAGNESLNILFNLAENQDLYPYKGSKKIDFQGHIKFNNVSFRYQEQPVLQHISFEIKPGKIYAVTGPNSAGKTTLLKLILAFYMPEEGKILAESISYDEIDLNELRKSFGVVMQEPMLFSGTIRENILYGNENVTEAELNQAAKLAMADEFIEKLPGKYEAEIGEDGVKLSGGERQKIAIARALIRNPVLLMMDEPTNHLDEHSVVQILKNIDSLEKKPAVLLISHDEKVMEMADHVFRIESGRLIDNSVKR